MTPPPILEVDDLSIAFEGRDGSLAYAVRGVGFALRPGRTLALVGESGSGKSLTALSLLGLLPPGARVLSGHARFHGRDGASTDLVSLTGRERRGARGVRGREIAMIFQEPMTSLNPVLSIAEQLTETIRLHQACGRREARERAIGVLRDVGIADAAQRLDAYPHEFSGGMRQRVMIAIALACRPRVLLADEPTTALDVTVQAQILDLLCDLQARHGLAILLITHSMGVVAKLAHEVCVIHAGRVMEAAPAEVLFRTPRHPYTRALLACAPSVKRGTPGSRLPTVESLMALPGAFAPLEALAVDGASSPEWVVPWWPAALTPLGPRTPENAGEPRLARVGHDQWVRVRGPGASGLN